MEFEIHRPEDWSSLAEIIVGKIQWNVLLLKGDLGAGKTSFTRSLVAFFQSDDIVTSPTYSIVNEYDTKKGKVFHFDLYRLNSLEEVYEIGIEEYLDEAFLSIIEWPDLYESELKSRPFHQMHIENLQTKRIVRFE